MTSSVHSNPYPVSAYSVDFNVIDYFPFLSFIKLVVDYVALNYWQPDENTLAPCARHYYEHITHKDDTRCYFQALPIIGNVILLFFDAYESQLLDQAREGSEAAIEELMLGTPRQRSTALDYCLSSNAHSDVTVRRLLPILANAQSTDRTRVMHWFEENMNRFSIPTLQFLYESLNSLPNELKNSLRSVCISKALNGDNSAIILILDHAIARETAQGKAAIIHTLKDYAMQRGNQYAVFMLAGGSNSIMRSADHALRGELFHWLETCTESSTAQISNRAWACIQLLFSRDVMRVRIINLYIDMLKAGRQPSQSNYFLGYLEDILHNGNNPTAERALVLDAFIYLAERGNIDLMHRIGLHFSNIQDSEAAERWYTRAAQLNHEPSKILLGKFHLYKRDFDKAIYWFKKVAESTLEIQRLLREAHRYKKVKAEHPNWSSNDWYSFSKFDMPEGNATFTDSNDFSQGSFFNQNARSRHRRHDRSSNSSSSRSSFQAPPSQPRGTARQRLEQHLGSFSTKQDMNKKFRQWAVFHHPDKCTGTDEQKAQATRLFQDVSALVEELRQVL